MAAPPTLNLIGEVRLLISLLRWRGGLAGYLIAMSFFRAAYRLYLFSLSQHGEFFLRKRGFSSGCVLEYFVCALHWGPLNILVLCCYVFDCLYSLIKYYVVVIKLQ